MVCIDYKWALIVLCNGRRMYKARTWNEIIDEQRSYIWSDYTHQAPPTVMVSNWSIYSICHFCKYAFFSGHITNKFICASFIDDVRSCSWTFVFFMVKRCNRNGPCGSWCVHIKIVPQHCLRYYIFYTYLVWVSLSLSVCMIYGAWAILHTANGSVLFSFDLNDGSFLFILELRFATCPCCWIETSFTKSLFSSYSLTFHRFSFFSLSMR